MIEFTFNTDFILDNKKQISDWLLYLANTDGFTVKDLHYNFVSAEKIKSIHKPLKMKHLGFYVMRSFISAAIKIRTVKTWLL